MRLFYDPNIQAGTHVLREDESHHCTKVLRLVVGDTLHITNGKGSTYKCEILVIHQKKTIIKTLELLPNLEHRNYKIHIAIAPTKSIDRFEWFLEKATEIGIDEITPIICKNSERKIIKHARLNRVLESAMKQSHKSYHPILNEQISFSSFLNNDIEAEQKFIAHCENDNNKSYLGNNINKNTSILILIGPEGDFNAEEIELSKKANFLPVSLGNSRLRTETAGIVACNLASTMNLL